MDHIRKLKGTVSATSTEPIKLNGGFASSLQELQLSGHARLGFNAQSDSGTHVTVSMPKDAQKLDEDEEKISFGEQVDVMAEFPKLRLSYPFHQGHITDVRKVSKDLAKPLEGSNEQDTDE